MLSTLASGDKDCRSKPVNMLSSLSTTTLKQEDKFVSIQKINKLWFFTILTYWFLAIPINEHDQWFCLCNCSFTTLNWFSTSHILLLFCRSTNSHILCSLQTFSHSLEAYTLYSWCSSPISRASLTMFNPSSTLVTSQSHTIYNKKKFVMINI